jgi:hypothetical protein
MAAPVCRERVVECLGSASYWVEELPRYADRNQRKADWWALVSGCLAALTSLAIWPVLTDSSTWWQKGLVSAAAFAAAVCALVPRIWNFAEHAGQARELSSRYGELKGSLKDLAYAPKYEDSIARDVVARFQSTKEKKDALPGLRVRSGSEVAAAEEQRRALLTGSAANDAEGRLNMIVLTRQQPDAE